MDPKFLRTFQSPTSQYRGAPFWAWNGTLEPEELRRQVRLMHRMGLGGFFMHSRVGLATAYLSDRWFECVSACVDEAEKLDMQAWLYDEDRWPSGAAGGLVTKNPKYRMRSLVMRQLGAPKDLQWTPDTLAAFTAKIDGRTARDIKRIARGRRPPKLARGESILVFSVETDGCSDWYNGYTYLDTMSHEAVRQFIRITHEAYRKHCGPQLGQRIPGIFTDEPNHRTMMARDRVAGAPDAFRAAWTPKLPQVFKKRYGYDLIPRLPELFFDVDGRVVTPARVDYHDCTTFLFVDAFARQIGEWCDKNKMQHTGHVLSEDALSDQTSVVGSCMRFYEHMQAPGIDLLTERWRIFDTAKQCASAARQFGRKWRLSETYGCTGWDFPFRGHKALGDWQVALGINLRAQHLAWYTMEGEAKRDYPASIFYQSPWWESYAKVEDYFGRILTVMTRGREVRDLLVVHPVESMWALCRANWGEDPAVQRLDRSMIDLRDTLLAAHLDFDYGDEDILARHAAVGKAGGSPVLKVAKAAYKAVAVPPMLTIRGSTLRLLKRFRDAGGTVVFAGAPADHIDARPSPAAADLARACAKAPAKGAGLIKAVEPACRRLSITDAAGKEVAPALYLLREDKEAFYLFVCNTSQKIPSGRPLMNDLPVRRRMIALPLVRIRGFAGCAGRPIELDPDTGERFAADARKSAAGWEIRTSLPTLASRLFVVPKKKSAVKLPRRRALKTLRRPSLGSGPFPIALSEPNPLAFDKARFRISAGPWQKTTDILQIDRLVRDSLGIQHRGGAMVQPWARPDPDLSKHTTVTLAFDFNVRAIPGGDLFFAIERPDLYGVTVNGQPLDRDTDGGWWVDKSLRKLPVDPATLRLGTNEIIITCHYDPSHPGLEYAYLLGNFGTAVKGTEVTLTAPPTALKVGDWVRQGLAFYSGNVTYLKTVRPFLRPGQRLFVAVPKYEGAAVRILIDGRPAGIIAWEPNELDVTDLVRGKERVMLGLEVLGSRRNSHGPFHLKDPFPQWTGPGSFSVEKQTYDLKPVGLMAPPQVIVRK